MDILKNKKHCLYLASSLLCLLPILIGVLVYNQMPESMPIHFNISGEVDGLASKNFALFGLPFIFFGIDILTKFIVVHNEKNYDSRKIFQYILPAISFFVVILEIVSVLGIAGEQIILLFTFSLVGIMFIVLGFHMPNIKQNKVMGVRTPWSLSDEENWVKTHKFSKYVFIVSGFVYILLGFIDINESVMIVILFANISIMLILTVGYSYLLHRKKLRGN